MFEKRIGKRWLQYGRFTNGIAFGFNISRYFINIHFLFWWITVEL